MKCLYCKKEYITYDEDAGTYKENYCSEKCIINSEHESDDFNIKINECYDNEVTTEND